jgi:WD40 repeat protein
LSVYDLGTGETLCTFGSPDDGNAQSTFSPDGRRLLTVAGKIHVTVSAVPGGTVTSISSGGALQPIHLWNAITGEHIADLDGVDPLARVCFSPDGARIITLENTRTTLFDGKTGTRLGTVEGQRDGDGLGIGDDVFFSSDSSKFVIRMNGPVPARIRSSSDGHLVAEQRDLSKGFGGAIQGGFSPDAKTFAFSNGQWLQCIDTGTGSPALSAVALPGTCEQLWYARDGAHLYALTDIWGSTVGGSLLAIDSQRGTTGATTQASSADNTAVAWSPDGGQIVLSHFGPNLEVFDATALRNKRQIAGRQLGYSDDPFSPDGWRAVAICEWPAKVDVLETKTWRPVSVLRDPSGMHGNFSDAIFVGDSAHLLTATDVGTIQLWFRRRPEAVWGVIALPQFWIAFAAVVAWAFSLRRDLRRWKGEVPGESRPASGPAKLGVGLGTGFWHEAPEDGQGEGGDRAEEKEAGVVGGVVDDGAGDELAEGGADADGGGDDALGEVEAAGAAGEVGDNED